MEKILRKIEKLIPRRIYTFFQPAYHMMWAILGALVYRFPSRKLVVIGVTGTKGKSSSTEILNTILEEAGYKTAVSGTIRFKIGDKERPNKYKMSMPGRVFMQKFLREAVDAGCTHAIIETTSEGSKFFRHLFIAYDALIFLNLSPEHIESHGSYENYVQAKVDIAKQVARCLKPKGAIFANTDDAESGKFLAVKAPWWRFSKKMDYIKYSLSDAKNHKTTDAGISFDFIGNEKVNHVSSSLKGVFNIYNSIACIKAAQYFGVDSDVIVRALGKIDTIKGRVEFATTKNHTFDVVIDYAHTADSLKQLYEAFPNRTKVCLLGSTGGGRDVWKRPLMGEMADKYCDHIILANEDPYDEDPMKIINDVKSGIRNKPCDVVLDRKEAISKAIKKASDISDAGRPIVLITGKGTDPYIMGPNNTKTSWSDMEIAKEDLKKYA